MCAKIVHCNFDCDFEYSHYILMNIFHSCQMQIVTCQVFQFLFIWLCVCVFGTV